MKKIALILALTLLLSVFAGCTKQDPAPQNNAPTAPALSGSVTIAGDPLADHGVTAQVKLDAEAQVLYQWKLDGEPIPGATRESLQIPVSAAGKQLSVTVTSTDETKFTGSLESEAVAVGEYENQMKTLAGLYQDVKLLGRTPVEETGILTNWSATGFEIRVNSNGGEFRVGYDTNDFVYFRVYVDGQEIARPLCGGKQYISLSLTAGEHTVKVVRDSGITPAKNTKLSYVEFDGTVLERPADKKLYIEVIGDSIVGGLGALGTLQNPVVEWKLEEHSATHSFGWYLAEMYDADVSLVSKGGIGVVTASSEKLIQDLYPYADLWHCEDKYDFACKPDLVVVKIGANDPAKDGDAAYIAGLTQLYQQIIDAYGEDVTILWAEKPGTHAESAAKVVADFPENARHIVTHNLGGSGSGPAIVNTGHPNAQEQKAFADAIADYINAKKLLG